MKYTQLVNEAEAIQAAWGYDFLEAVTYMWTNRRQYKGTVIGQQLSTFMQEVKSLLTSAVPDDIEV